MIAKAKEHHLIGFYVSATPEGEQVRAACTCGAELIGTGNNRAAASDQLWQVFEQHKAEPRQVAANVQAPKPPKKPPKKREKKTQDRKVSPSPEHEKPVLYMATRGRQGVTKDELAEIAQRIRARQTTAKNAARELGVCQATLYNNFCKTGLYPARATPKKKRAVITDEELADLAREVLARKTSVAQVAGDFEVSPATLYRMFRKAGLNVTRARPTDRSDKTLVESIVYLTTPARQGMGIPYTELAETAEKIRTRQTNMARAAKNLGVSRGALALAFQQANLSVKKVESIEERFHSQITILGDSGCWQWNGHVMANLPYIRVTSAESVNARRYAWSLKHGPLPDNKRVYVTCGNPQCVNPNHLTAP